MLISGVNRSTAQQNRGVGRIYRFVEIQAGNMVFQVSVSLCVLIDLYLAVSPGRPETVLPAVPQAQACSGSVRNTWSMLYTTLHSERVLPHTPQVGT